MKYLIITLLLLSSCSTERKCRRVITKAEKLGCLTKDSITIYDTLILTDYDTTVQFDTINEVDTLFAENNGIKTVVFTKWKTREVRVVQKADTIVTKRKVPQLIVKPTDCHKQKWWDRFWIGFILGLWAMIIIIKLFVMLLKWSGKPSEKHF